MNRTTFDTPPIRGQKHFGTGGTFHTYGRTTPEPVATVATVADPEPVATEAVPTTATQTSLF